MTDNTPPVALEPCPFCGGEAYLKLMTDRAYREGAQFVACGKCHATAFSITAWNTRTPSHSDLVEALRAVEAAMIRGGDGRILDVGWNITKLNQARPMIRAILTKAEAGQ